MLHNLELSTNQPTKKNPEVSTPARIKPMAEADILQAVSRSTEPEVAQPLCFSFPFGFAFSSAFLFPFVFLFLFAFAFKEHFELSYACGFGFKFHIVSVITYHISFRFH